jgi:CheY-like chemotaxis protein
VFELAKEIRFNKVGQNPFIVISLLVNPKKPENIAKAIEAGADDVIIRPLQANKIYDRLRMITYYRQPFVATSDYIGPERKNQSFAHPGARRVNVLNTMFEKVSGRTFNEWELKEAIQESLGEVIEAQLTSQSMKMSLICDRILDAYNSNLVTPDVADLLEALGSILKEAADMARSVKDTSLEELCGSLAKNVGAMHAHYETATKEELSLIDKLAQAFRMAIDSASQRKDEEEEEIAARYEGRVAGRAVEL